MNALRRAILPLTFFALALVGACAADSGQPIPNEGRIPSVLITDDGQYVLRELRIHRSEDYAGSPNLLATPLQPEAQVVYYGAGETWVTVFREKFAGGPILAFTMQRPMMLIRDKAYALSVFDESFRLTEAPYVDPLETTLPKFGDPGLRDASVRVDAASSLDDAGLDDAGLDDVGPDDAAPDAGIGGLDTGTSTTADAGS